MNPSFVRSLPPVVLVSAAIVLGGGGSNSPGWELGLELVFALVLGMAVLIEARAPTFAADAPNRSAIVLAVLIAGLPLVQLVPLPAAVWHSLPGRSTEIAVLSLADAQDRWMPWSMTPSRTLAALLAMIVPAGLMVMVARLDLAGRARVLGTVVVCAIGSVMLGALQVADGEGGNWRLQSETHLGYLTGFQANRNHQADLLLIALLAAGASWAAMQPIADRAKRRSEGPGMRRIGLVLAAPMLLFGLIMTGSRAGLMLFLPVLIALLLIVRPRQGWGNSRKLMLAGALAAVLGVAALLQVPAVQRVAMRFVSDGANRAQLWEDTRSAIALHWPAGTGMGSFEPIFIASESLKYVDTSAPVRAHSDWLEFTLEAGLPGWLILAAIFGILAWQARSALARGRADTSDAAAERGQVRFALAALMVLALHSTLDYPLRSMSLACLAGVAAAMLFRPAPGPGVTSTHEPD